MPLDWPVEYKYHESIDYLNWLNMKNKDFSHRLMKEKEFYIVRTEREIRKGLKSKR